ncbi:hypothetical protein RI129_010261 [Pyrocoelia pectoralis]|uniref:Uncharacterized protein n=1 Tax=Pyrocoelia pectoralis TaxID=417401 RepID=A0AAN7VD54_9COLE
MENSLMFLIKLAWELKYRIPCLIAVSFLLLDIRMRLDVEVQVRRIQFQQPLQPGRRRNDTENLNEEDGTITDSDSWLTTEEDE